MTRAHLASPLRAGAPDALGTAHAALAHLKDRYERRCCPLSDRYRLGPEECSTYAAPWPRTRLFNARPRNAGGAADETPKCAAENAGSRTGSPAHSAQAAAVCTHGAAQSPLPHAPARIGCKQTTLFPRGLSRVQHQLEFESTNGELAFTRARRRHGLDSEPTTSTHDPAAPTDYPTSPPVAAADTQAPGRRPPDAGAGPVPKVVNFEYRGWCSLFLGG